MKYARLPIIITMLFWTAGPVFAKQVTYDFNDPKGVNSISIVLDSEMEPMTGFANTVKGEVTIDPVERRIVSGTMTVPSASLAMSNGTMTQVLHSKPWLNVKDHPEITFVFKKTIAIGETLETKYNFMVEGDMTIAGVTRTITAPVTLTFLPGKLKERFPGSKGDLVIMRSSFEINRNEFRINPEAPLNLVSDTIQVKLNVAGGFKQDKP
jgi:polyisoprenoid-binding protein YceI